MTIEKLQEEMIAALKAGNKQRKVELSVIIANAKAATITPKGRLEMTEELVNEALRKEAKVLREQIETCPANRTELLEEYKYRLSIVEEFAPQVITDKVTIKKMILQIANEAAIEGAIVPGNKKIIMPKLKSMNVDMKIANEVLGELTKI